MSQKMYDDVYVRSNLSGNGKYPENGAWTQSPDIIPNGIDVIVDPVTVLKDSYSKDVGKKTVLNQQNFYYIRAKNLFNGARTAKFELYYCPSNIFMFPSLWVDNQLETSGGDKQVSASVDALNDIVVPINAFTNIPKSTIHHCMVGRVITDTHPNPLPESGTITDMNSLAKFILDKPGFCWRNIVLVSKDVPTFTHYFDFDTSDGGGEILMGINCKNITKGSFVAFSCGDPIPSGPDKGSVIQLVKTEVTQDSMFLGQMTLDVPAKYKTKVSYTYWGATPIQKGWEAEFTAILITPPGHELHERATPVHEYGFDKQEDEFGGIKRGVQIGACSTKGN